MKKFLVVLLLISFVAVGFSFIKKTKPTPLKIALPEYVSRGFHSPNFPNATYPVTQEGFELGRHLFYDINLSKSKTISCASCHIQTAAFTDTSRFSIGVADSIGDRNSMPLANIGWSSRFFWDGRAADLISQIHDPVIDAREMANTWADVVQYVQSNPVYKPMFQSAFPKKEINATQIKNAIAQFVGSIYSFQSRYDDYAYNFNRSALNAQEIRGLQLFNNKAQCANCHNTLLFTNHQFMNNGLDAQPQLGLYNATGKIEDKGLQKTPSLRNVAVTAPYMHDGRFKDLHEVVDFYNTNVQASSPNLDFRMLRFVQPGGLGLNQSEKEDLIAFLHTLTDTVLLSNPIYSNPWK